MGVGCTTDSDDLYENGVDKRKVRITNNQSVDKRKVRISNDQSVDKRKVRITNDRKKK
jgi:hypothetical protein